MIKAGSAIMWIPFSNIYSGNKRRLGGAPGDHLPPHMPSRLEQAAREARSGRYEQALRLLDRQEHGSRQPTAEEWDLRAKVYAQLGYFLDAERCWLEASQADPDNPGFRKALARLRGPRDAYDKKGVIALMLQLSILALLIALTVRVVSTNGDPGRRIADVSERILKAVSDSKHNWDLQLSSTRGEILTALDGNRGVVEKRLTGTEQNILVALRELRNQEERRATQLSRDLADARRDLITISERMDFPFDNGQGIDRKTVDAWHSGLQNLTRSSYDEQVQIQALEAALQEMGKEQWLRYEGLRRKLEQMSGRRDKLQSPLDQADAGYPSSEALIWGR